MKRRTLLQYFLSGLAALPARLRAQSATLSPASELNLRALADVVLPQEIGEQGRDAAVRAFLTWARDYRADVATDSGYGFPRLRRTPPSPTARYAAQLDALDRQARARNHSFTDLPRDERRVLVEAAIAEAKVERLPSRPDGGHVASDLMGFYFNSIEANDVAYRAKIGRDMCRGLAGSENKPAPLEGGR
jgi:hypothetical protein